MPRATAGGGERTQIQLTESQYDALKEQIHRQKLSLSAAIREPVDLWLRRAERSEAVERSIASLGRFRSGKADVAARHDDYLAEAYDNSGRGE